MNKKLFDLSWIIGALFAILGASVSLYTTNKKIPTEYMILGVLLFTISLGVILLITAFSNIKNHLEDMNKKIEKNSLENESLNKRFKIIGNLNDIRLDVRELQKKVFKK